MITFNIENSLPKFLSLKNRNRYLMEGWIVGPSRIKEIIIKLGSETFTTSDIELHRPDVQRDHFPENRSFLTVFSGFSIPVIINPAIDAEERSIILECEFADGTTFSHKVGTVMITPWEEYQHSFTIPPRIDQENLLVICMATYNPSPVPFKRQIDSIIAQDCENWICIICDDNSPDISKALIKAAIKDDARFFLVENDQNVGFYYNIERCLELVPEKAKYVALSDQDDIWYPQKLTKCLDKFIDRTMLVYCDMNIVDKDRNVLSNTYWKNRKNYYESKDIDLLTLANTVTGAASVFRRELLDLALPFPPRYGAVFHDQWLAITAAGSGGIEYVDESLYEYVQYGDNVIGHVDFGRKSLLEIVMDQMSQAYRSQKSALGFCKKLLMSLAAIPVYAFYANCFKHTNGKHVITLAETALLRELDANSLSLIKRTRTIKGLFQIHRKVCRNKETLNNIELVLLFGEIAGVLFRWSRPLLSLYIGSRLDKWVLARCSGNNKGVVKPV